MKVIFNRDELEAVLRTHLKKMFPMEHIGRISISGYGDTSVDVGREEPEDLPAPLPAPTPPLRPPFPPEPVERIERDPPEQPPLSPF